MAQKLVTAPATEPVSLEEAKLHLREDGDDQDDLIDLFIQAAREAVEKHTGRRLIDQVWDVYLDEFPDDDDAIEIALQPIIEVVDVFYTDSAGVEQTMDDGDDYLLDIVGSPARIKAVSAWPSAKETMNAIRARVRVGYLDQSVSPAEANVPAAIKAAILLTVGNLYANRETIVVGQSATELTWAAKFLLRPFVVHRRFA